VRKPIGNPKSFLIFVKNNHKHSIMVRVEHIGIAVNNIKEVNDLYKKLFAQDPYKSEKVESEHVETSFFQIGETKIEFLEADAPESAIAKYIEKKGQGIHHIAFEVEDIHAEMERLSKEGFRLINEAPKKGADNKLVCFVHPKSTNGVLVELCQEIKS
jgi:methylmalonyl-CoA/ethylmalonyl-CoA epimerase